MKTALVLSGGGAKGAYEVGCYRALRELGYSFDIICGASIGAMNGLLICQGDDQELYDLWDRLSIDMIFKHPVQFDFSIESLMKNKDSLKPFIKSYLTNKGGDNTPFKEFVREMFRPELAKNSKMAYGLTTVEFPQLKPVELSVDDMEANDIIEYAIASASCFPAFPIHYIGNQGYIDGGYYDNLPIHLAFKMGASQVIAIELNEEYTHPHLACRNNIDIIRPSLNLGGFMDFSRDVLDFRIQLGYLDTMKHFGKLAGYRYCFRNNHFEDIGKVFHDRILEYEMDINYKALVIEHHTPLLDILKKDTYATSLTYQDYFILGLELYMNYCDYPMDCIYEVEDVIKDIDYSFNDMSDTFTIPTLNNAFFDVTSRQILNHYYHQLSLDKEIIYENLFLKEYLIAMFVHCLKTR